MMIDGCVRSLRMDVLVNFGKHEFRRGEAPWELISLANKVSALSGYPNQ